MACIKSGSAAGSQSSKGIGLLDSLHELFDSGDHAPCFANRLEGQSLSCFALLQPDELLAVELSATVGSVGVDLALPLMVGRAGLVKESLAGLFFNLQSQGG